MRSVDLDAPAETRFVGLDEDAEAARALFGIYAEEVAGLGSVCDSGSDGGSESASVLAAAESASCSLTDEERSELAGVADWTGMPLPRVWLGNFYYDLLSEGLGCTAFAARGGLRPLHARNLDWWSPGGELTKHTVIHEFSRGGELHYRTVGWPGFVGALSGVAPGRFSVTLNAVLSDDSKPLEGAVPMTVLLRRVLDTAACFEDAVTVLAETPVLSDSLIMVVGVEASEMAVVERTPSRSAVRRGEHGFLVATNDYRTLGGVGGAAGSSGLAGSAGAAPDEIGSTSCSRWDRTSKLVGEEMPWGAQQCFEILSDRSVQMGMTAQQIVLCPASGRCQVRFPGWFASV